MSKFNQMFSSPEQDAQAVVETYRHEIERLKTQYRGMLETLCAKERRDGSFVIDFMALAAKLSLDGALELRASIDEVHRISGAPGEKPRIRVRQPKKADA